MPDEWWQSVGFNELSARDPADAVLIRQELRTRLRRLPSSQRLVLLAHEHQGYSYQEVADRYGFTRQTVEKYLVLAKAQARRAHVEPSRFRASRDALTDRSISAQAGV